MHGYAPKVNGGNRRGPRGSLATHFQLAAGALFSCALIGFAACNTYDDSLLASSQGATDAGGSGGAGNSGAGASGGVPSGGVAAGGGSTGRGGSNPAAGASGGSTTDAGAAGVGDGGDNGGGSAGLGGSSGGHAGAAGGGVAGTGNTGGVGGSGAGGTGTTGGSGGTSATEMIDDFEANDLNMQVISTLTNGRNGYWYAFHDLPATGSQSFGIVSDTTRSGSKFTLHMSGMGFTGYGAGFGADFVNVSKVKAVYDVSAYKGIRFYAKIATGTQPNLKLLIPTTYSDPMGGKCNDAVAMMGCNDHLFCAINGLTTAWAVYECDFALLKQGGFGLKQTSFDPKSVYSVQFSLLTTTLAANIWVDDVAFVLK